MLYLHNLNFSHKVRKLNFPQIAENFQIVQVKHFGPKPLGFGSVNFALYAKFKSLTGPLRGACPGPGAVGPWPENLHTQRPFPARGLRPLAGPAEGGTKINLFLKIKIYFKNKNF